MPGGCLDARGDGKKGYNMQGERMFEPKLRLYVRPFFLHPLA